MVNTELILVGVALAVQATALLFWLRLHGRVERWVWWSVTLGFIIMAAHRVGEMLNYNFLPQFTTVTAILIALIALISVLQTRRWVRKREQHTAGLAVVHNKLEALSKQLELRESLAVKVAEILGDLRQEIDFYKDQARDHHLPLYNGGTDRTRTG